MLKNNIAILIYCLSLSVALSSCKKFLELDPPKSSLQRTSVFSDEATATSAMRGVYAELLTGFASGNDASFASLAGLSADELRHLPLTPELMEFELNQLQSENPFILPLWTSAYKVIYLANTVIEGVENSRGGLPLATRDQLSGEAYFVRSFCYFFLTQMFGDVPLVISTNYDVNSLMPRAARDLVDAQVLSDLNTAYSLLDENYVARSGEKIRVNKSSAAALLARVYLYKEDWLSAEAKSTEVINNSSMYGLNIPLDEVFLKNSKESIWQLTPLRSDNGNIGATSEAQLFSFGNVLNYYVMEETAINDFEPGDLRIKKWNDTIFTENDTFYFPHKYKQDVGSAPTTEYSMVLRLAEQYLIRAEARAMQDKFTGANSAEEDINEIRNRAGLANTTATTRNQLLDAVMQERRVELFSEWGHRWLDLKRTGKAVSVLSAIKDGFNINDELYPVPQDEFNKNPELGEQNAGY